MLSSTQFKSIFKRITKFGLASSLATAVDFLLFRFVLYELIPLFYAELFASLVGMIINFFVQKKFVFELRRNAVAAFGLSLLSSFIILLLGSVLITQLNKIAWLAAHISVAKIIVIGTKFIFNFIVKQWIFEKKVTA